MKVLSGDSYQGFLFRNSGSVCPIAVTQKSERLKRVFTATGLALLHVVKHLLIISCYKGLQAFFVFLRGEYPVHFINKSGVLSS